MSALSLLLFFLSQDSDPEYPLTPSKKAPQNPANTAKCNDKLYIRVVVNCQKRFLCDIKMEAFKMGQGPESDMKCHTLHHPEIPTPFKARAPNKSHSHPISRRSNKEERVRCLLQLYFPTPPVTKQERKLVPFMFKIGINEFIRAAYVRGSLYEGGGAYTWRLQALKKGWACVWGRGSLYSEKYSLLLHRKILALVHTFCAKSENLPTNLSR